MSQYRNRRKFRRNINERKRLQDRRRKYHQEYELFLHKVGDDPTYFDLLRVLLPTTLHYMVLECEKSEFYYDKLINVKPKIDGTYLVPQHFSIVDQPLASFDFLRRVTAAFVLQSTNKLVLDYSECESVDLGAQVLLDIIMMEIEKFYKRCEYFKIKVIMREYGAKQIKNDHVRKMIFTVGSPVVIMKRKVRYRDIEPYNLCIHNRRDSGDPVKIIEQKDLDTTMLVDYVIKSLNRLGRNLTPDEKEDLSTVVGEILINAEEHSTFKIPIFNWLFS